MQVQIRTVLIEALFTVIILTMIIVRQHLDDIATFAPCSMPNNCRASNLYTVSEKQGGEDHSGVNITRYPSMFLEGGTPQAAC